MGKLEGKIAVVTGGSSGIGLATAQRFVAEGAHVYITGRRQAELDKAKALIGKNVTAVQADSAVVADLDRLYARVRQEKGRLDVLVVNSGQVEVVPFEGLNEAHFDRIFNLNARGALFTTTKAVPLMTGGGAVVLVGSGAGFKGIPGYTAYSATKAALRSYARTWTAEFKDRGIRVNTLSPGPVDTPIMETQADTPEGRDAVRAAFASMVPLGRLGRSEEIAAAALFLASDESSFVAGIDLCVDGGLGQV